MFEKMEKVICKMGSFFGMKKMNFSKVEPKDDIDEKIFQETLNENEINLDSDFIRLVSIDMNLSNIWNEIKERATDEIREIKWKYAGIVLNRFFFYVTLFYSIITFCSIILTIPNLYRSN